MDERSIYYRRSQGFLSSYVQPDSARTSVSLERSAIVETSLIGLAPVFILNSLYP